jgi:hypothetical protein
MKNLKRMRLLCGLRQIDLSTATGIALYKISSAETGRLQLSVPDSDVLRDFLLGRWRSIQGLESGRAGRAEQAPFSVGAGG